MSDDPLDVVARLVDRLPELGRDGEALSRALGRWLAGEAATLEAAIGLSGDWRAQERRAQRDALIRALGGFYPGRRRPRAEALARDLQRYQATGWRADRHLDELPAGAPERRRLLHAILRLDGACPTGWRRLHEIISERELCSPERVDIAQKPADCRPKRSEGA